MDYKDEEFWLMQGDCLERMKEIPSGSVDMVLCDLPYGTTACKWDSIVPFEPLWEQYKRVVKKGSPVLLFGREPFTSKILSGNMEEYKHKWVWNKKQSGSFQNAKYMPLQIDEDIVVFCNGKCNYYPQMRQGRMRKRGGAKKVSGVVGGGWNAGFENRSDMYFPTNIIEMANPRIGTVHPTQKPVALMEYLIKTYTNDGETVLDNTMGGGTTGVACSNLNRKFIGIEMDIGYFDVAKQRILGSKVKDDTCTKD